MVVIEIKNNNVCEVHGKPHELTTLYQLLKIRHPNQFYLRQYMPRGWDGKIEFIKKNGTFAAGLLERVGELCDTQGFKWDIMDNRNYKTKIKKVDKSSTGWTPRDYQKEAIETLLLNKPKDITWIRGTCKAATNAGKTTISGFTYLYTKRIPTIFLMNSTELYHDAIEELPKIIGEDVGYMQGSNLKWANFMICMAPTLRNKLKDSDIRTRITKYQGLIVDECDMAGNKTNKEVIEALYNTHVRLGLSGTVNASKLKQDLIKNLTVEGFFGKQLYEISNRTLIDKGVSSEVAVKIIRGNEIPIDSGLAKQLGWQGVYDLGIINNKTRNIKVVKRSKYHLDRGRRNQLIIAQRHDHIINLMKLYKKAIKVGFLPKDIVIDWVHHDRKDRKRVVKDFKEGKIDILVGSMILKRGKNFPLMKYMLNAGGGKSPNNIIQLLGRAFRGCNHYEDFFDMGEVLKRHARRRIIYYKNEKLHVDNPYK